MKLRKNQRELKLKTPVDQVCSVGFREDDFSPWKLLLAKKPAEILPHEGKQGEPIGYCLINNKRLVLDCKSSVSGELRILGSIWVEQ